ncbi:EamA family transporter RarD [Streptomyces sp. B6B3]|uniref:EamA family transporter RarD n=1 Tax=Streptomyces sp. B6B3 TaxID=3153570 RepID=UPI00325C7045
MTGLAWTWEAVVGAAASRAGLVYGLAAFGMWGLLPLYWHELEDTGPWQLLAHRMLWSLPTALVILALVRSWSWIRPLLRQPKQLALLALSASLITVNWGGFIWAVANDRTLEASLGYFINPLISIAIGVLLLRERLRRAQWVAVGIGALAVVVMSVAYGQVPWLALALSFSFGTYGLVKKKTGLDGVAGFSADAALHFLPALGFLLLFPGDGGIAGGAGLFGDGVGHTLLLVVSGPITALPLILFGAAAVRVPLSTLGLMQYLAPSFMFLLGIFVFHEEMPPERLAGFLLVWAALSVLTWDALRAARRDRARRSGPVARSTPAERDTAAATRSAARKP